MSTQKNLAVSAALASLFAAHGALAAMVTDAHGNVGYDTAAECDAAVIAGTAKFYKPFTRKAPALRAGETRVQAMSLKELLLSEDTVKAMNYQTKDYKLGACDIGVGAKAGQNGVTKPLLGKYVPYNADMLVNVFYNKAGAPVRASMKQCDNRFANALPRPIPGAPVAIKSTVTPANTVNATPAPTATTVSKAPVAPAPVGAALGSAQGSIAYKDVLGAAGLLAVGAILMHSGDTGTGTVQTTPNTN